MKTPGQLAYEAYCATRYGTEHLPIWYGEISAEERSAWEAAAKACRPVVDDAMVERASAAIYKQQFVMGHEGFDDLARAALKAALGVV